VQHNENQAKKQEVPLLYKWYALNEAIGVITVRKQNKKKCLVANARIKGENQREK